MPVRVVAEMPAAGAADLPRPPPRCDGAVMAHAGVNRVARAVRGLHDVAFDAAGRIAGGRQPAPVASIRPPTPKTATSTIAWLR